MTMYILYKTTKDAQRYFVQDIHEGESVMGKKIGVKIMLMFVAVSA